MKCDFVLYIRFAKEERRDLFGSMDIGWLQPLPSWSTGENGINQTSSLELDDQQPVGVINGDDTMDPTAPAQSYSLTETLLISAALLIIIVGTIVGNILVCTAVCLVRRL